jgi:uncharacterized protein YggU (UPF0235/DUF167 family)
VAKIAVRLTPRGGRDALEGWATDAAGRAYLKVRVSAAPIEGEANDALERLLAKALNLSKSSVRVTGGATARVKRVEIDGLEDQAVLARLNLPI